MPPSQSVPPDTPPRGRQLLLAGGGAVALGLGLSGTVSNAVGSYVVLGGWILLIYGLHRFGRSGAG